MTLQLFPKADSPNIKEQTTQGLLLIFILYYIYKEQPYFHLDICFHLSFTAKLNGK